jgi:DNA-binding LytR/AlgR family response regulator
MKVFITESEDLDETSVEIHCRECDAGVRRLERHISSYEERFACSFESGTVYVNAKDIYYFEAIDNKTFLYTRDQVYEVPKRLYELEGMLNDKDFFRCSKAIIVNVTKIERLKPELTRNIMAVLSNGEVVVISRRYVKAFRKLIYLEELG